jgi:hypothetical protein
MDRQVGFPSTLGLYMQVVKFHHRPRLTVTTSTPRTDALAEVRRLKDFLAIFKKNMLAANPSGAM